MKIFINGESRECAAQSSVLDILQSLGINPKTVVVQRNEDIVDRESFGSTLLIDGDALELVRFVGGG
ncbi:MAG: sulfur carrier protein ThiS [Candidatus Hydrogenedentes bacterium]|nr:sulfur carrier protein ThiS [Candidatus Hydrogenedentota bacterium]